MYNQLITESMCIKIIPQPPLFSGKLLVNKLFITYI